RLNQQRNELGRWEERNRLARDLHDSVCQNLFSLSLLSRGLESFLQGPEPEVAQTLEEIQQLTEDSLKEMRSLIWQLRPAGLEQGLVTALRTYGEKLGLTIIGNPEKLYELPRTIEETLWRIGQEALNNVSKHAGVNEVKIVLQVTNSRVQMEIRDKGKGFPMSNQGRIDSLGLVSMRERSEMLGGLFQLESAPGRGTTVRVSIPFY
ncbi:MAG TPA: sensor histidine kinase, partial [Candidatus Bathyarchaeia archaeon]|nr:sensor histidine kinase [Candidatus Bathyarchaeia archaeon]